LQAEFDNYRKRTQKDAQKAKQDGLIEAVEQLLPVLDTFKAAEKQLKPEEFKGLKQVKDQLTKALENLGVKQIKAKGETFDPNVHNAIVVEKDENEDAQVVLDVLQEGYSLDDRVIRHSVVKINE
jgi:molecular chaperone GrpE